MKHLIFGEEIKSSYRICILVNDIRKDEIEQAYIEPFGLNKDEIIILSLHQNPNNKNKTSVSEKKAYITEELVPVLEDFKVEYLIVGDGSYFKILTKTTNVDSFIGYVLPTEFGPWMVTYVPNYRSVFFDKIRVPAKISLGIKALKAWIDGKYQAPGTDIIKYVDYPDTVEGIASWLRILKTYPALSCDIEAFSLKHYTAGIGTITFCWSAHEGIAFAVDYSNDPDEAQQIRQMLREFFKEYEGKVIYHNIAYDAYVLVYQLFMEHLLDTEGLLYGLDVMLKNWDDTKLIAYLATNSCSGNNLGLKELAQEHAGHYAQEDIADITKINIQQLLRYNLIDGLSTWFVYEKYWDAMVSDQQLNIYETVFKPATKDIIQMQLTGLPLNIERVSKIKDILQAIADDAVMRIQSNSYIGAFIQWQTDQAWQKDYEDRKEKAKNPDKIQPKDRSTFPEKPFNPGSSLQLQQLLYDENFFGLPVLEQTKTKAPATGGEVLEKLLNHANDPNIKELLKALVEYKAVDKLLTAFIPAFENAAQGPDGWHYLFGNFNLGGTVSGRLSSSDPNLQNLPANVTMIVSQTVMNHYGEFLAPFIKKGKLSLGKLVKWCFQAPPGWFFCGIDFASLEDRISALTTKDPNKIKVYKDGYDGHCLRAYAYFGDQMTGIIDGDVASINSIEKKYPDFRQDSKAPTFALTYQGTYLTLMKNCGFSQSQAMEIEARYHELYKVSDQWVKEKLDRACIDGFVTVAFGLRVRTPKLAQVIRGTSKTPFEAEAEGRTAGNALGQSYCLLNSRAGSEFMGKVRNSIYRYDIRPCAQIHDAQYFMVRDDVDVIHYANIHVVKACEWQELDEIRHPEVKLGGTFSLFYPDWSQEMEIPNRATVSDICSIFTEHLIKIPESIS